ncbi:unnamed protein product, partial [marine sediment metagenome]
DTYTDGSAHGEGGSAFWGGVLAPNGDIILVPWNSDNVGIEYVYMELNKNICLHPFFNKL